MFQMRSNTFNQNIFGILTTEREKSSKLITALQDDLKMKRESQEKKLKW